MATPSTIWKTYKKESNNHQAERFDKRWSEFVGEAGFLSIAKRGKQRIEAYEMSMPNLTKEFVLTAHEKYTNKK